MAVVATAVLVLWSVIFPDDLIGYLIPETQYYDSINLPIRTPFDVTQQDNKKTIYFNVTKEDIKKEPYYTFSINFYYRLPENEAREIELMDACNRMQRAYGRYVEDKSLNSFEKLQQKDPELRRDQFVLIDLILEQQIDDNWQIVNHDNDLITYRESSEIGSDRLGIKDIRLNLGTQRVTIINKNPAIFYRYFDQDIEIERVYRRKIF